MTCAKCKKQILTQFEWVWESDTDFDNSKLVQEMLKESLQNLLRDKK